MEHLLEQIESVRKQLNALVSELKGDFLHPSVIDVSRKLDDLILEYLKMNSK